MFICKDPSGKLKFHRGSTSGRLRDCPLGSACLPEALPGDADVPDPSRAVPFECPLAVVVVVTSALRLCKYFFFAADAINADADAALCFSPRGVDWAEEGADVPVAALSEALQTDEATVAPPFITSAMLKASGCEFWKDRRVKYRIALCYHRASRFATCPRGAGRQDSRIFPPFPSSAFDPFEESALVLKVTHSPADKL